MMFLKYFCCRETLLANITIGEIKNKENTGSPVLEVQVHLTLGSIRQTTDFLYLQPQMDLREKSGLMRTTERNLANSSTADSNHNMRRGN